MEGCVLFYYLSKLGFFLIRPSNVLLLLLGLGLLLALGRYRKAGWVFCFLAFAGIGILGLSPAANLLLLPLEERFSSPSGIGSVDGIILLGGAVDTVVSSARSIPALTTSAERLTVAATLAQRFPSARVIHTGSRGARPDNSASEAVGAELLLQSFGIEPSRIVIEDKSRNTWENAVLTKELIKPVTEQNWLLVTSAYHMPRAVGVFRQAGWTGIIPYPVDWRTRGPRDAIRWFSGVSDGLKRFDTGFREWVGLAVYRLSGRSDALLPKPETR